MSILSDDIAHVWHPFTQHQTADDPIEIVRAEGVLLYDVKGKSYIDANSSWWVNVHGHGHPHIAEAINDQFKTLDHVVFAGVTHPKAVELATRITAKLPEQLSKVFFSDNGSTAIEIALKMAFQYFHNIGETRRKVVAMQGSYHGDTFGAMSVGQRGYFNKPFEPFFFDADYIDFPNESNEQEVLQQAKSYLEGQEVAVLIVEPLVQGAAGMRMYSVTFLEELTKLAHDFGTLVIFDEVMTGFGRTGKLFAGDFCSEKPDFVALSKGLTAGVMALGLTVASDKVYQAFMSDDASKALLHGHSFTANPIACAVACANLDLFEQDSTWEKIKKIEAWGEFFLEKLKSFDNVCNLRRQGTITAFEVNTGEGNTYFSDVKKLAYDFFLKRGILLRPLGNVIFINPPYTIKEGEYDEITAAVLEFLDSIKN
ncbi:MAG: adenosylmethionine--8-amino-7-oxononanoate transaminase [Crocinitomicaceae bacterium]|nr:adenosylmethionine--8-amino-7-oxononanoate transaminase [Crocinitomicaceae bacterium]MDG1658349.1 adenosylmethionine--8-amino-7-oxononanoate transaminase [Crocinitomicaceae bacterium]